MTVSHGDLIALPTDPMPGVDVLIAYYTDPASVPLGEVGHAALHMVGYGYGLYHTTPTPMMFAALKPGPATGPTGPDCCDNAKCLDLLKKAKAAHESGTRGTTAIPWATLIALAMQILQKLLSL